LHLAQGAAPQAAQAQEPYRPKPEVVHSPQLPGMSQRHDDLAEAPFLRTQAPSGGSWRSYLRGAPMDVDAASGFLVGPWAECVCWGVVFEHSSDWQRMPEYHVDGPVGGVLAALERAAGGRADAGRLMDAATRLEEAAHDAACAGRPLPVIGARAGGRAPDLPAHGQPAQDPHGAFGQPSYMHPSQYQPPYGEQQPGGDSGYAHGPTLLQQHRQNVGGRPGGGAGKMAMAAAGGVAAGAGGYALAEHADAVGGAVGDAAGIAGGAVGDAAGFAGDVGEAAFHTAGDAVGDMGDLAEGIL